MQLTYSSDFFVHKSLQCTNKNNMHSKKSDEALN